MKVLYNYGLNEKGAKRTMKVQKPLWEQKNMIGNKNKDYEGGATCLSSDWLYNKGNCNAPLFND